MANPSKAKGCGYERELVNQAKIANVPAKRAWGSNGESLGLHSEVDCLIGGYKVQAKRKKKIADYMKPSEHVDIQMIREDHGKTLVVMNYKLFLKLIGG